ncbi:glutamate and aspartate transporter subunit; membrane component of ABC superfamily [Roseovarius sp. EC-HK134]|mgnify:FL=1|jgi:glutamate/aspartate transport system permease protein|uniref:Glutamate/aspartate import permease protein GltK n=1 Tax=Roseovarius mucosus TaxID=215743 RepID=A0A1V0RPV7_9RHOB|nr:MULTISPECIES: amino acid ABC transporter permease [Roseovarius]ARE83612.1 glutamate/aspartate import permease protein GltK [Roseovarius mucosus]AWZ19758.1 Glutamate Aspartate transport system permease protein GltK [Roseovarius sp. AK1035]EDM30236.1 glutamate/aspartate ABC transporter, permease protein [Roseovarius sp. TM1035]MBW4973160.1 amino acid ABC transporter permease [Roseovarius mucosus]VVT09834.1 glutamate and aspartate transporter subunit; membrane component of ABC superfamily [Ros|tara:strand:+ start:713 stop:1369 length:657 start_codon:yes stop_codon:yes gene_type:complete
MGDFDFDVILNNLPFLWQGLQLSLWLTFLAVLGGIALGTLLALARLSGIKPLAIFAAAYVNLIRSVPLILVIFWFYFLVPLALGRPIGGFYSALIAFVMFEAAYYSEIMRAGIQSVRTGQVHAGQATGLGYWQIQRYIVLPQAFRNMIPILVTQGIILFQDTSLVFVVSLRDLMTASSIVARTEGRLVEMYLFAALVYFVICFSGSLFVRRLQARMTT